MPLALLKHLTLQRYYKFLKYTNICMSFLYILYFFEKSLLQSKEGIMSKMYNYNRLVNRE